jgi:hypothetical protein
MAERGGKRVMLNPNGQLVQVSPTEAESRLATGLYSEPSEKQISAYDAIAQQDLNQKRASELQTPGAMLETGVKSGLNAFAAPAVWAAKQAGLGDIRDIGMSPEEAQAYHEREAKLSQYNPVSSFAGELGGQLVGLKGLGSVAGGVREGLGLGRAATTLGRAAVAGGEGAYLGASQAMEDPDATAEHVLASGALGAILGAGTSAVFGAASNSLSKVFGRVAPEAAELSAQAGERAAPSTMEKIKQAYNSWTSKLAGADKGLLEEVGPFGARRVEAEKAAHTLEESINQTALKMQPLITDVDQNVDKVTRMVRDSAMKKENLARIAGPEFETWTRLQASRNLVHGAYADVAPNLQALEQFEAANPEVRIPAQTRRELQALRHELEEATEEAQNPKARAIDNWMLANGIKQKLDNVVQGLRTDARRMSSSVSHGQSRNMLEIASGLQKTADATRESLMDESLWGKAVAGAQRDVNEAWAGGAISAMKRFGKNFMRDTGEEHYIRGGNIFVNDPAQTAHALRTLATPEGFMAEGAMSDYIQHVGGLVKKIGEKYGVEGGELVEKTLGQLEQIKTHFSAIKEQSALADKFAKVSKIEQSHGGIANHLPILGAMLGGPVGAGVGMAARAAMQPAASGQAAAALVRSAEKMTNMTHGVGTWLSKGAEAVSPIMGTARNAGVSSALQLWRGSHKSDSDAFQERSKSVLAADVGDIGPHIENLPPSVQAAAGGQVARALQFLTTTLPANAAGPSIMNPSRKVLASAPDQQKFAQAWATVVDPTTAVKDLKRGRLSPIQVQTLKTVYPKIYDDMRVSVLQGIGKADAAGVQIPLHTRQQLDLLLDLHGAGQPAFSDAMVGIIQNGLAQANKPGQKPGGQKSPQLASSMKSPSQALAG